MCVKLTNVMKLNSILNKALLLAGLAVVTSSCTKEGVINKTKYNGKKVVNTCEDFTDEVKKMVEGNISNTLMVSQYDNSDFDYYFLEPGQFEVKNDTLYFRLSQDLEYDKYLHKRVAVHVMASYKSLDHLTNMEDPNSGELGMLKVDREYYDNNSNPFFLYKIPITEDLNGKQVMLTLSVVKYTKKGKVKKVYCNSVEVPLGPMNPSCCGYVAWDPVRPTSIINISDIDIKDEKYKYQGFTGTVDIIHPYNSEKIDDKLTEEYANITIEKAIREYVEKYQKLGYKVKSVSISSYASPEGALDLNQNLSNKRSENTKAVLLKIFPDGSKVSLSSQGMGEDWTRFSALLEASKAFDAEEKKQINDIVGSTGDPQEREMKLKKLSFWKKIDKEILTYGRHSMLKFDFEYVNDKMYVEKYSSELPVNADQLKTVVNQQWTISKYKNGSDVYKNKGILDKLIMNNEKANLYAMRSTYQYALADVLNAIRDIESAQNLDKDNEQYAMAAIAYKTMYAYNYSLEERLKLLEAYNQYVEKFPGNKDLFFNRAVMMDKIGLISGALAEYDKLLEGKDPEAYQLNNRGVAKLKTYRVTEAEADFKAAIEKDSKLGEAYYNLAIIYAYKGLPQKCYDNLDKAIEISKSFKQDIASNPVFDALRANEEFDKYK